MDCETCAYYVYDEEEDEWFCEADMDQDDFLRMQQSSYKGCLFYRNNDEYAVVRHQM